MEKRVFIPRKYDPFEGLFGIFSDSLPDGWGRLLLDMLLLKNGVNPAQIDSINRLAIVGKTGMGALVYQPEMNLKMETYHMSLDEIAIECQKIFESRQSESLDQLFQSFLYYQGRWQLSPAYDLTYSNSIGGEHATTVNGNGYNPGIEDLLAVAERVKLDKRKAKRIAENIREIVNEELKDYF